MARRSKEQIITDLIETGATTLREAHEHNVALTAAYKTLAGVIVDLRKQFRNSKDTAPDWAGQTQAYRDTVALMYSQSGVPQDAVSGMQAAIRYHIGNVLRDRLSADELTAAGLSVEGPLDRSRTNNRRNQEAASSGGIDDPEWFDDTISSLKSVEAEHPEVVILDLRDTAQDVLPMLHKCLTIMQAAHLEGVTPQTKEACVAILDQVLAEAAAFRAEAAQVQAEKARGSTKKQAANA